MLNTDKITFRCLHGNKVLFTPEYMHDVLAMRTHPEYEELNKAGEVVKQPEELVQRPLMAIESTKTLAPSTAAAPKTPGKTNVTSRAKKGK